MKDEILYLTYSVIDSINRDRSAEQQLVKSPETVLFGSASALDSLGLIHFVVAVEEQVEKAFGHAIVLADDRALAQDPVPFSSVATLVSYIEMLLRERNNA